jgi:hypothetical protein
MANAINKGLDALGKVGDIGFVDFTTKLVSNVYDVVITSEIEQMKAYAQLVKDVSQPLAEYQKQVTGITFNDADMLSAENIPQFDSYIKDVLTITLATASETQLDDSTKASAIEHFNGLTIAKGTDEESITATIDGGDKINNDDLRKFVYQKLAENTKEKYDLLLAVLKLGPKGIEVVNCQIKTALMYDVKANENESSASTNVDTKATNWESELRHRQDGAGGKPK